MCQLIAHRYGLSLEVVSLHEEYWDNVMEYALRTVKAGLTPNPDMMCNRMIKFGYFEQRWGKDFDLTATGHYATTCEIDGTKYLATAVDAVKDQTDFLAQITYDQLQHLIFPIGAMPKSRVREIAQQVKLPNASRKDSQGICFLGQINYNDFIRRHLGVKKGPIIEIETGRKLGEHNGYWFHTIGQRKGLYLSGGPWFVVRKDIENNVLYVSQGYDPREQYGDRITLMGFHPLAPVELPLPMEVKFKIRHTPEFHPGRLVPLHDGLVQIESGELIQGIAAGQYATIYDADAHLVIASGMIV
jgi:tRNA-specific 2-thiouridylase